MARSEKELGMSPKTGQYVFVRKIALDAWSVSVVFKEIMSISPSSQLKARRKSVERRASKDQYERNSSEVSSTT